MIREFAGNLDLGLDMCKLLIHVCDNRLALGQYEQIAFGGEMETIRMQSKCVKAVAKTFGVLFEHDWWRSEYEAASVPLARLAGPAEGQPYLCLYSVPHASIAFLFRTGSFNPADVVQRNGGELACRLCGARNGDTPQHLVALCNGGANATTQRALVDLRARAQALFGASELVDWAAIAFGLVAKYRNVTAKKLTRERVEQGCQILFEFYTLRRKAGVAAAAAARR